MNGTFHDIKIQGISTFVPKNIENNRKYNDLLGEENIKKQCLFTGIEERHVCIGKQTTADLCHKAAEKLIEHLGWKKESIKVLLFVTQFPSFVLPSTAFLMHKRLGLEKECVTFDINLGCSGFNIGMQTMAALLQGQKTESKALMLIGDDTPNKINENEDEEAIRLKMLFGSSGSAIAVEVVENHVMSFMNQSDGSGYDVIMKRHNENFMMNGIKVFDFAITDVVDSIFKFKELFGISEEAIDYYVFHQAQKSILDDMTILLGLSEKKVLVSYKEYANNSGGSIPLTICSNEKILRKKEVQNLLMCGFGVGLSWGIIATEIQTRNIIPIHETDEYYDDELLTWCV